MSEVAMYYQIATTDYPESAEFALAEYGNTEKAILCAAECAYIQMHQELPEWGYVIEDFNVVTGDGYRYIFIHRDPNVKDD